MMRRVISDVPRTLVRVEKLPELARGRRPRLSALHGWVGVVGVDGDLESLVLLDVFLCVLRPVTTSISTLRGLVVRNISRPYPREGVGATILGKTHEAPVTAQNWAIFSSNCLSVRLLDYKGSNGDGEIHRS